VKGEVNSKDSRILQPRHFVMAKASSFPSGKAG